MYALTAVVLTLKMAVNSVVQGVARNRARVFTVEEDARMMGGRLEATEVAIVDKAARAWRNDLENIPIFLILAGIYVMAGLGRGAFEVYCSVFMVMRILHTYFYLNGIQPWRTVAYTVGAITMLALVIQLFVQVVLA
jgi:glutathione S-transferase